ncbi:hypothetical protein QWZ06_27420 [Chryseobacterium tructae]|uniref:Uncharacterized protein n=1 Tax=Chryseobacterium tructae TaxID=1037380 RepID=A0ABV7XTE1_9FLAO|nr:hypothetical protein [Chryseobacterium tructae]MDN3695693.1 hypothetical protein [Chryseobacterium tructae]
MSKFLSEKKKLLEDVYKKASSEATETSFNGIIQYLDRTLKDEFEPLSYKSFENYYKAIVENDEDYNIKTSTLDNLSRYLGYETFKDYRSEWRTMEYTIQQAISKIVITIINKPILAMPGVLKQNGLGIAGAFLIISVLIGNHYSSKGKSNTPLSFFGASVEERSCMFWEDNEYRLANCEDKNPQRSLIPKDTVQLRYFKRITRKDTLTIDNALGKTWYSKYNGNVEFFTMDGVDPDTGRELRASTAYIIDKYAGY